MESGKIELFDFEYIIIGAQLKAGEETLENVLDKALKGRIHEINLLGSCTNELGIEMGEAATEILALEFRKFLAFNAFRALYQIDKNKNDMSRYAVNGEKYYESVFIFDKLFNSIQKVKHFWYISYYSYFIHL